MTKKNWIHVCEGGCGAVNPTEYEGGGMVVRVCRACVAKEHEAGAHTTFDWGCALCEAAAPNCQNPHPWGKNDTTEDRRYANAKCLSPIVNGRCCNCR